MKKLLTFVYIMMAVMAAQSQVVTLKFVGADRTGQDYVRLHHVSIYDHDQLWHQVIYYPDTTLALYQNGTTDIVETRHGTSLQLYQNTPNPFTGTTDVNLTTVDAGDVTLEIVDGNGRIVETFHETSLQPGTHQFRVSLNAAGTYVMTARQNGQASSIKMVCNGGGGSNSITHVGTISSDGTITLYLKSGMSDGSYPFRLGDRMEFIGYAVIDETERVSETVTCNQGYNSDHSLKFDVARPAVTTLAATGITAISAIWHGEVTADNNALVTERGFCWVAGNGTPTMADNHVAVGDGVGTFDVETWSTASLQLQPHTAYRVRAYAVNAVGVSYGETKAFATSETLPVVTTTQPTNVAATSFTCGGNVVAVNAAALDARGVCWNTTGNPTIADSHTTDGTAAGSFTSSVTGLEPATQYFVRAYATNAEGTAYGEIYTVTTLNDIPTVITAEVSNIAARTAQCGGEVMNEHGANVTQRGVCWNTTGNPIITDSYTTDGIGLGEFVSTMNVLTPNTQYYVRAYATNSVGTAYGAVRSFTTLCDLPEVTTTQPTNVASTAFTCGGNVVAMNSATLSARGVCWNTTGNPTVTDSHTTDGTAAGSFTSSVTGLEPATQYYVRAYATNAVGTAYGETYIKTTMNDIPIVVTADVSDIAARTAQCGGEVVNEHGAAVTERGVCWNTTGNPTIADSHTTDGNGLGEFASTLNELTPNTQYYVRAYATNSVGTAYGEERSFTTLCDVPEVTTTQPADMTSTSFTCGGDVIATNCDDLTARGVCWNTTGNPTVDDSHTTDGNTAGGFTSSVTGLECGTTYYVRAYATNSAGTSYGEEYEVTTLAPTIPDVATLSATLYNGLNMIVISEVTSENCEAISPRGICYSTSPNPTVSDLHTNHFIGLGTINDTIIELNTGTTYYVRAYATNSLGTAYGEELSVTTPTLPTVTTTTVTNIAATTATCGGNVTDDGGAIVTARGVCWSTNPNPTILDIHTMDGNGIGGFTSNLTNLIRNTTYYVRAYAANSVGTAYGLELSVTTLIAGDGDPCPGTPTLTDIDGNTYNTVLIGNQCWMKENLRTTKYATGTSISQGSTTSTSTSTAYWYYPDNYSSNMSTYGLLYNWKAVMRNSSSSSANPSGVKGICPTGWHIPSDAEWTQLTDYVSSQSQYVCGSDNTQIAKALASTTFWGGNTTTCAVGNTPSNNNATGFSALPAGYYHINYSSSASSYQGINTGAYHWSATESSSNNVYVSNLFSSHANVYRSTASKTNGNSVRCIKD